LSANANDAPVLEFIYDMPIYVPGPDIPQVVFVVSATDINGDTLTFEQSGMPNELCFFQQTSNTSASFTCEFLGDPMDPTSPPQGVFPTTLTVTDDGIPPELASQGFNIFTTTIDQQAPVLAFINNQTVAENAQLVVDLSATDADQNTLTFSTENLPGFCILTDNGDKTGNITCNPIGGDANNYVITVSVIDDGTPWVAGTNSEPLSDSLSFELVVGGSNQAPVLNPIGNQFVADGSQLQIDMSATDADMDQLSFGSTALPGFCDPLQDFGDGTARIVCNPLMESGDYPVTVTVTDNGAPSLFDDETFTITVTATDFPPSAEAGNSRPILVRQPAALDGQGDDLESFQVVFSWQVLSVPPGSGIDVSALSDPTTPDPIFVPDVPGDFVFELTVTDDANQTAIDTVTLSAGRNALLLGLNGEQLHQLNPQTGASYLVREVLIAGQAILDGNGMATDYSGGPLYGAFEVDGITESVLTTIDPLTGAATMIGGLGDYISALTFHSDGTLYAVTADIATTPQTLYTVDTATGAMTFVKTLGTDGGTPTEGDVIAFNRNDGLLYRAAREGITGVPPLFESINLGTDTTTPIPLASSGGGDRFEVTAMVWDSRAGQFVASRRQPFNNLISQAHYFLGSDGTMSNTANQAAARRGYAFLHPFGQVPGDHNGDGTSDILWRNAATGQNWVYMMNGATITSSAGINTVASADWQIVGNGDYDGDGLADILWRNSATGQNWMYLMNGNTITSSLGVNTVASADWQIVGNGDYDGDGHADILWRNSATGQNWMYLMNGATIALSSGVNTVPLDWEVAGNGDFNGDGSADILWRNSVTGQNWLYTMSGSTIAGSVGINTVADTNWKIASTSDYNGDGKADIVWRNSITGQNWMYLMNGASIVSSIGINTVADTNWKIVGSR
jgi:hypothetical protein